jgi:hypothetical protein
MAMFQVLCFRLNTLTVEKGCRFSWKTVTSSAGNRIVSDKPVDNILALYGYKMRNQLLSTIALLVAVIQGNRTLAA